MNPTLQSTMKSRRAEKQAIRKARDIPHFDLLPNLQSVRADKGYKPKKTDFDYYLAGESEMRAKREAARMLEEQFAALKTRGWKV